MNKHFPTSVAALRRYLQKLDFTPFRKWGQNFLCDERILEQIAVQADLHINEAVLEIGGGLGHLTHLLAPKVSKLWCVEIDPRLCRLLEKNFAATSVFQLLQMDVLDGKHTINPELLATMAPIIAHSPYKLVANLPYNAATAVIINFLEYQPAPVLMVLTVQKEVAQRLAAPPGSEHYGPLTIVAQLNATVTRLNDIAPNAFYPRPKVYSSVVKLVPQPRSDAIRDYSLLKAVIRSVFSMRRKTLTNALRRTPYLNIVPDQLAQALKRSEISGLRRGETLSIDEFIALANALGYS